MPFSKSNENDFIVGEPQALNNSRGEKHWGKNMYKSHEYTFRGAPSHVAAAAPKIAKLAFDYEQRTGTVLVVKVEQHHDRGTDYLSIRADNIDDIKRITAHTIKFSGSEAPEHEEITRNTLAQVKLETLVLNYPDDN